MRLPSGELVIPTGADVVRVSYHALVACDQAAAMLRRVGFALAATSMRSEACYYTMPGYHGAIRIAAHRLGRTETREMMMPVVSKITFGEGRGPVKDQHVRQAVLLALGGYIYTRRLSESEALDDG